MTVLQPFLFHCNLLKKSQAVNRRLNMLSSFRRSVVFSRAAPTIPVSDIDSRVDYSTCTCTCRIRGDTSCICVYMTVLSYMCLCCSKTQQICSAPKLAPHISLICGSAGSAQFPTQHSAWMWWHGHHSVQGTRTKTPFCLDRQESVRPSRGECVCVTGTK